RAGALELGPCPAADDPGRIRVHVLAASIVDRVVVRAQERGDHRAHRRRMIAEWLAREHRCELHHASALLRRAVLALAELDRLMGDGRHGRLCGLWTAAVDALITLSREGRSQSA